MPIRAKKTKPAREPKTRPVTRGYGDPRFIRYDPAKHPRDAQGHFATTGGQPKPPSRRKPGGGTQAQRKRLADQIRRARARIKTKLGRHNLARRVREMRARRRAAFTPSVATAIAPRPPVPVAAGHPPAIAKAVEIARKAGVPVVVEGHDRLAAGLGAKVSQVPAAYHGKSGAILINERHPYWSNPKATMDAQYRTKHMSSDDPHHIMTHEVGHALHDLADTDGYKALKGTKFTPEQQARIAGAVSKYGATQPLEFVAEVYAGRAAGKVYDPFVMTFYRKLKGPE